MGTENTGTAHTDTEPLLADFHTHLLSGIDDGAPDAGTSAAMLRSLCAQGVGSVVLTPHFYTDREPMASFLERRNRAVEALGPLAEGLGVRIFPACELYFTDYVFNYDDISPLCVCSGRYLLVEFPFSCSFSDAVLQRIERLMASLDVIPILAHIERYPPLLKRHALERLAEMGCLAQINLGSFSRLGLLQRKALLELIRARRVHLAGTDCHNMTSRPPDFLTGWRFIERKAGKESSAELARQAARILENAV